MIPDPVPKVEEFSQPNSTTYNRFPGFNKIVSEIANAHVSKRPK